MVLRIDDYYPSLSIVRDIDEELNDRWGIDFFASEYQHLERFQKHSAKIQRFFRVQEKVAQRILEDQSTSEKKLMEIMADFDVNAAIASMRRAYILDGISMASGIISLKGITGSVLDIGTHIGVVPNVLSKFHSNKFVGIDPVGIAISSARSRTKNSDRVRFDIDRLPSSSLPTSQMVICLDVLGHIDDNLLERSIGSISSALEDGGYALVTSQALSEEEWCRMLADACKLHRLGIECYDVHGGYQDIPPSFRCVPAILLRKGSVQPIPIDVSEKADRQWNAFFPAYANDKSTPLREKTQAFARGKRK